MEQMNGKELAQAVAYAINSFNFDAGEFCEQMHKEHRTLQQNFMRLIRRYIEETAKQEYFDDRNEASVMACRKLSQCIEDNDIYLPFI